MGLNSAACLAVSLLIAAACDGVQFPESRGKGVEVYEHPAKHFAEDANKDTRDAKGKKLVEDICTLCHEWQRIKGHELTKEQWSGVIKGMISEGAPVTDEEFDLIVEYLAKNYGPAKDFGRSVY
jgi:cytochrome c5